MNRRQAIPGNSGNAFGPGGATGVNPLVIAKSAIPFINISSGSIGNNGALSGVTALGRTFSNGAYCYFPANAIAAGVSAGWYWTVFSSTTAGTIYNSTYTSGVPVIGTTTAFSTTGPGAYTGDTTALAGPSTSIPAGAIGANGSLRVGGHLSVNNTAGTKQAAAKYSGAAGTTIYATGANASVTGVRMDFDTHNVGLTGAQITSGGYFNTSGGIAAVGPTASAIDTTAATTLVWQLQKNTATDNMILETYRVELLYGA